MKEYRKICVAVTAVILAFSSCIDEVTPTQYVTEEQISNSESALGGMVNSIYTTMVGYSNKDGGIELISYASLLAMLEHATTPMVCTGTNGYNTLGAWHYGSISSTGSNRGIYPSYVYYGYIKTVNDIIGMIDSTTTDATQRAYLGIAYAYRALYYMEITQIMEYKKPTDSRFSFTQPENDLTNLGVPIVTEKTSSDIATHNPRVSVDENFSLVLGDLVKAENYLADFTRTDKVQPDKSVVYGLYARAYSFLASHANISAKYKDAASYWRQALQYAEKAIASSHCTPLTEQEWTDPKNGFNSRTSQNSWMLATSISESNTNAAHGGEWGSFGFAMLYGTETNFSAYGWRVGRSLDRRMYERLADTDFRKKSWLDPNFFYESKNQLAGQPYLVERDVSGSFINNKWNLKDDNTLTTDSAWSKEYSGRLNDGYKYQLTSGNAAWIRSRINMSYGFQAWPWLYVNIKFRPHNGDYQLEDVGGAVDFPAMRVEEMYFIKAEALMHTQGLNAAKAALEEIVKTRNPLYSCIASSNADFIEELAFQKAIEFWGEGRNYFDAKRLELGIHRGYKGTSCERYQQALDMNGVYVGWTPGWNQAELNTNHVLLHYNNPYTNPSVYRTVVFRDNEELRSHYGEPL